MTLPYVRAHIVEEKASNHVKRQIDYVTLRWELSRCFPEHLTLVWCEKKYIAADGNKI